MPLLSGAQMTHQFERYRELQAALDAAMPDAIITVRDKKFRRKPYWRGVARAFNLEVTCVSEQRVVQGTFADGRENFGYLVTYVASAPGAKPQTGDGACFAVEKAESFRCPHRHKSWDGKAEHYPHETCPDFDEGYRWRLLPAQASEHNVRAHAHTRAYNRAVSNLVGFGEVSAEEVERDEHDDQARGPARPAQQSSAVISEAQRKRLWAIAKSRGWSEDLVRDLLGRYGFEHTEQVTRDKYESICTALESGTEGNAR